MKEVRRIREERELSQARLSELSGVDPASLSLIETGRRSPGIEVLQKLADGLGCEVADFFPRRQPDLFATAPAPSLEFVTMVRATPDQRRQALGAASEDEVRRYRQAIDRQLDSLEKWVAAEEGYEEQDQATLAAQKAFLHALRAETDPFDVLPPTPDQRAALATTHASGAA